MVVKHESERAGSEVLWSNLRYYRYLLGKTEESYGENSVNVVGVLKQFRTGKRGKVVPVLN
jgi:hypothetical protein